MKHRVFIALVISLFVPFLIMFRVSSTPSEPLTSPIPVEETSTSESLRSLAQKRGIYIGPAVAWEPLQNDANYRSVLAQEFNILTPENIMKFEYVHPQRDRYDFTQVDALVAFAKANNIEVRGHPLVWHHALPRWLWLNENKFTRDELIAILREHIQTVVGRYRGQVVAWDVVSEAINRDGSLRDTIWLRNIGPEYIDLAFRWAHEADPKARLFYSDYGNDEEGPKPDAMYNLVRAMLQRGVPISGVGLQTHRHLKEPPSVERIAKNMKRHADLGIEVQFTELDVQIVEATGTWEERLAAQGRVYSDLLRVCLAAQNCTAFMTWGFTDRYTWVNNLTGKVEAPLIFDTSYRPKPAYEALKKALSSGA
ncbi:MAG TPA: endo-1,4-beta-xylanase [Coleofasciculaceae cyanobacterium]